MRWPRGMAVVIVSLLIASSAQAEMGELVATTTGALALPGYQGSGAVTFTTAGWDTNVGFEYGLLHDLYVGGRFGYGQGVGVVESYDGNKPRVEQKGDLAFDTRYFHPQIAARYNLYAGYNMAPYLEVAGGFLWSEHSNVEVLDENGRHVGDARDFARRTWTVEAGIFVDYRLLNILRIGAGASYVMTGDDLFKGMIRFPVRFGLYWF